MKAYTSILILITLFFSINISAQWYGYGQELSEQSGSNVDYFFSPVWQDSTVISEYSGGVLSSVWLYGLGQVFDPTSDTFLFAGLNQLSEETPYFVDSLAFPYSYIRNFGGNADTLFIQFFKEENMEIRPDPWTDPSFEDVSTARLAYDSTINRSLVPFLEIAEILDDEDISEEVSWKTYHIGEAIDAGEVVAATITYKTGNPYNSGDTLTYSYDGPTTNKLNEFIVRLYRDYDRTHFYEDYNHAFLAVPYSRYPDSINGWPGQYWTGNANFGGFYHANIQFFITELVGVNEVGSPASLVKLFPNPASEQLTVTMEVPNIHTYTCKLTDITGKLVMKTQPIETSSFNIDVSNLEKGIYHLQFSNPQRTYSERLVIDR